MNNVTLIGRLVRDPEVRYTPEQMAVARFTIAVDRISKDKGTDFIPIVVFGKQAENCERFIKKGSQVGIVGNIKTGSYTKDDGTKVYTTDVVANRVKFLDSANKNAQSSNQSTGEGIPEGFSAIDDEDIPF